MPLAQWKVKKTASGYQHWTGYPDSPVLSIDYPYQVIVTTSDTRLYVSQKPIYHLVDYNNGATGTDPGFVSGGYDLIGSSWFLSSAFTQRELFSANTNNYPNAFKEANSTIYDASELTGTYFAKTTTAAQDAGIVTSLVRL